MGSQGVAMKEWSSTTQIWNPISKFSLHCLLWPIYI